MIPALAGRSQRCAVGVDTEFTAASSGPPSAQQPRPSRALALSAATAALIDCFITNVTVVDPAFPQDVLGEPFPDVILLQDGAQLWLERSLLYGNALRAASDGPRLGSDVGGIALSTGSSTVYSGSSGLRVVDQAAVATHSEASPLVAPLATTKDQFRALRLDRHAARLEMLRAQVISAAAALSSTRQVSTLNFTCRWPTPSPEATHSGGLPAGAIAGVCAACVAVTLAAAAVRLCVLRRRSLAQWRAQQVVASMHLQSKVCTSRAALWKAQGVGCQFNV
jgi:hypothetical protein